MYTTSQKGQTRLKKSRRGSWAAHGYTSNTQENMEVWASALLFHRAVRYCRPIMYSYTKGQTRLYHVFRARGEYMYT